MVLIQKLNEVFVRVLSDDKGVIEEIYDKFKYHPPNYQFDPRYRQHIGGYKGYTHLFDKRNSTFYNGLLPELGAFLKDHGYPFRIEGKFNTQEFSEQDALDFIKTLNLPFQPRDHQIKYFIKMVRSQRGICLSPTNSGKSLVIYLLYRYFDRKTLLIVPSKSLVTQMFQDFKDYGYQEAEDNIHLIMEGATRKTEKKLVIATWQSIYLEDRRWFLPFRVVLGDEVHTFQATSLKKIMKKLTDCPIRIGLTGTLTEVELSNQVIKGLFGPVVSFITQAEQIEKKISSPLFIKIITLKHLDSTFDGIKMEYQDEIAYIVKSPERIEFVKKLALSLKGNSFVMFSQIAHGEALFDAIKAEADCPVFYVDGKTLASEREEIRKKVESLQKSITVCSVVFATGINIKILNNLIFTHPSKSRIRVLQSVGRGLRKVEGKELMVYDIADDFIKGVKTYNLVHRDARIKMYEKENFFFKKYDVAIKKPQSV